MLGYAATTDVRDVPVVVADGDRPPASRDLIARFDASPNFTVVGHRDDDPRDRSLSWSSGSAWLALSIPAGYGERSSRAQPAVVQVIADGSDSNSTTVALGYATSLIGGYAQELVAPVGDRQRGRRDRRAGSASGSTRSSRAASS